MWTRNIFIYYSGGTSSCHPLINAEFELNVGRSNSMNISFGRSKTKASSNVQTHYMIRMKNATSIALLGMTSPEGLFCQFSFQRCFGEINIVYISRCSCCFAIPYVHFGQEKWWQEKLLISWCHDAAWYGGPFKKCFELLGVGFRLSCFSKSTHKAVRDIVQSCTCDK